MTTLLLFVIVILAVAICALAAFWFWRESRPREQKRQPAYGTRDVRATTGFRAWDGGTKTSPRQLR